MSDLSTVCPRHFSAWTNFLLCHRLKDIDCCGLHDLCIEGIGLQGGLDITVSKTLHDSFGIHTVLCQTGAMSMSQTVGME